MGEVLVDGQQGRIVPDGEGSDEGIDGPELDAMSAALVAHLGSGNVVVTVGKEEGGEGSMIAARDVGVTAPCESPGAPHTVVAGFARPPVRGTADPAPAHGTADHGLPAPATTLVSTSIVTRGSRSALVMLGSRSAVPNGSSTRPAPGA